MIELSKDTIIESIKQIKSIVSKIEAIDKNKLRQSQLTLIERRLIAMRLSLQLLNAELEKISAWSKSWGIKDGSKISYT